MPKQFTICPEGVITIGADGVVVVDHLAAERPTSAGRPVRVSVGRDLTLRLEGARFTAATKLSRTDACALMGLLAYALGEDEFARGGAK